VPEMEAAEDSSDLSLNPGTGGTSANLSNSHSPTEVLEPFSARKSITQYSGFNPDLAGTPSIPPGADRFIFVNALEPSRPGQRHRADRKTINAHVQTTTYRQRRSAAVERLNRNIKANVGRPQPSVQTPNRAYSQNSTLAAAALVRDVVSPSARPIARSRQGSVDSRIIGHGNTFIPMADEEGDSEDQDDARVEIRAMRMVLKSISQRMTSLEKSRLLHGSPQSLVDSADVDPFAIASVPITKGMNRVFSHCMSKSFTRTDHCHR
jgi:hypothetical protein